MGRVEGEGQRGSVGGGGEGDLSRRSSLRRSNLAISISKTKIMLVVGIYRFLKISIKSLNLFI